MAASSSRYSPHRSSMVWRASAAMIGVTRMVCAMIIACGVNSMPQRPERAGARQQQIDREPDHDRRQAHQRVEHDDHAPRGRESASAQPARRAACRSGAASATADRLTAQRQADDRDQSRIAGETKLRADASSCMKSRPSLQAANEFAFTAEQVKFRRQCI